MGVLTANILTFGDRLEAIGAMKIPEKEPIKVKRGNVTVKVYQGENTVAGKVYPSFTLVYYSGAQRFKRKFAILEEATREAELIATKLANGENEVLKLTPKDRAIYVQAVEEVRPFNIPLNLAAVEYADSRKRLPAGVSLREVVDFYLRRNPAGMPQKTVLEVAKELLTAKMKAKRSEVHLRDLTCRLYGFANAMQNHNIGQVTGKMIDTYLSSLDVAGRTKRNHLRIITSLFKFAIRQKYLPKDALDEVEMIEKPDVDSKEIEIFSPNEMKEILGAARSEMVPWLAMAAFAGLRSAELQRLDWADVDLEQRHIEITAAKAKTASRRLVPITDNLMEWLTPYVQKEGRVTGFENVAKQILWLTDDVNAARKQQDPAAPKFVWKRNALRHSFVSYRLAAIKDTAQVALEAGNSPAMVFNHYRQLVTDKEAAIWFSIVPKETPKPLILLDDMEETQIRPRPARFVLKPAATCGHIESNVGG